MKRIFLIRNAEHENTASNRWAYDNTGLSEIGKYQAIDIGKELEGLNIATIYSSTRERANQTAVPSCRRLGLISKPSSSFDAASLGKYAGLTYYEIQSLLGDDYNELMVSPEPEKDYLNTGESLTKVADRAWLELKKVVGCARDSTSLAIFTHKEIIGALLCKMTDMDLKKLWWWGGLEQPTRHSSITELIYKDSNWSLVKFGCTAHLKEV